MGICQSMCWKTQEKKVIDRNTITSQQCKQSASITKKWSKCAEIESESSVNKKNSQQQQHEI